MARVRSGELTPEWFTAQRLRGEAEREAHRTANPSPPSIPNYDPMAPSRAYLAERAGETPALTTWGAAASGFDFAREYQATKAQTDAFGRNLAGGARQRNAMQAEHQAPKAALGATQAATSTDTVLSTPASAVRPPYADLITPVQAGPPGGRGPTRPPRGTLQDLTPPEAARLLRFRRAEEKLREVEPNNPQLTYLTRPNSVPSEEWVTRLEAELAAALGRARSGQPPPLVGNQLVEPFLTEQPEALIAELVNSGTKITPANVIKIERMPNGRIVFLEQGNTKSGLQHIIQRHGHEFVQAGISQDNIPNFLFIAQKYGTIVGYQRFDTGRPIYEITLNGKKLRVAITVGSNGYVVGANMR